MPTPEIARLVRCLVGQRLGHHESDRRAQIAPGTQRCRTAPTLQTLRAETCNRNFQNKGGRGSGDTDAQGRPAPIVGAEIGRVRPPAHRARERHIARLKACLRKREERRKLACSGYSGGAAVLWILKGCCRTLGTRRELPTRGRHTCRGSTSTCSCTWASESPRSKGASATVTRTLQGLQH